MWICGVLENASWLTFIVLGSELVEEIQSFSHLSSLSLHVSSKAAFTTKRLREKGRNCRKITMWANGDDVGDFASQPKYLSISVVSQILVHIIIVPINRISSTSSLWTSSLFPDPQEQLVSSQYLGLLLRHNSPLAAAAAFQALPRASTTPSGDLQSSLVPRLVLWWASMDQTVQRVVTKDQKPLWHMDRGPVAWLGFMAGILWKKVAVKPGSKSPPFATASAHGPFLCACYGEVAHVWYRWPLWRIKQFANARWPIHVGSVLTMYV